MNCVRLFARGRRPGLAAISFVVVAAGLGCATRARVPPPESGLEEYISAVERRDAAALRAMMTERARSEYSEQEVAQLLARDESEFDERAEALSRLDSVAHGKATVYLSGGRTASLALEDGRFAVDSSGLVPPRPRSPEAAVRAFLEAVRAHDYSRIEESLTVDSKLEFTRAFDQLGASLDTLDSAIVSVRQERATIEFVNGRVIKLEHEDGVWKVEEFE